MTATRRLTLVRRSQMPASSAALTIASPSIISVLPASTDSAVAPAAFIASIVDDADDRHVEAHVLIRLRDLDDPDAGAGQLSGARDHRVGALHRLDGDDRRGLHRDRLADVEAGDRIGDAVAELEIRLLVVGRRRARQHARAREQRREERRRVQQLDAVLAQHVGDAGDERVGVLGLEPHQHAEQRHVGHDVGEELRVLDLPGHHGLRDAGSLEQV